MKNEKLLHAIGKIDDALISGAATDSKTKKQKNGWLKWSAMAACLALAVSAGTWFLTNHGGADDLPGSMASSIAGNTNGATEELPSLPILSVTADSNQAMGFEGYMAYDISELVNANPWNADTELSTLPVYRNRLSYDENLIVHGADFQAMEALLLEVADRLGMDTDHLPVSDNTPSAETQAAILEKTGGDIPEGYFNPTAVFVEENGIKIEVDASLTAKISFAPAVTLPENLSFSHYSSYDEIASVAGYLKETYSDLLGMEHPRVNIYGGDYNIYLQQGYHIEFYDSADTDSMEEQILNYNFYRTAFYCNDNDDLFLARVYRPDLSHKVADYPIVSAEAAEELLLDGHYITTVPCEMPGKEYISKVELIYRTGNYEEYYMPYYRFYVELPHMEEESGIKHYGAYYVPAVNEAYIADMPLWDGSFN